MEYKEKIEVIKKIRDGAPIRAISLKQPYASMMLRGKVETRTWATEYRGFVLICSSLKAYSQKELLAISGHTFLEEIKNRCGNKLSILPLGMAIAIGELYDCKPMWKEDESQAFVLHKPDKFCHYYRNVFPIMPIHWKGNQRWGSVDMELFKKYDIIPFNP